MSWVCVACVCGCLRLHPPPHSGTKKGSACTRAADMSRPVSDGLWASARGGRAPSHGCGPSWPWGTLFGVAVVTVQFTFGIWCAPVAFQFCFLCVRPTPLQVLNWIPKTTSHTPRHPTVPHRGGGLTPPTRLFVQPCPSVMHERMETVTGCLNLRGV